MVAIDEVDLIGLKDDRENDHPEHHRERGKPGLEPARLNEAEGLGRKIVEFESTHRLSFLAK